jgi:acetylornithine deacetylase/succinyl-diaminopimelate desuccinylase-like protein
MKAILFGAGSITDAHSSNEFVKIDDLKKAVEIYLQMMEILLKEKK